MVRLGNVYQKSHSMCDRYSLPNVIYNNDSEEDVVQDNAEAEAIAKYAITISVKVETMVMSVPLGLFPSLRSSGLVPQVWLPWSL